MNHFKLSPWEIGVVSAVAVIKSAWCCGVTINVEYVHQKIYISKQKMSPWFALAARFLRKGSNSQARSYPTYIAYGGPIFCVMETEKMDKHLWR